MGQVDGTYVTELHGTDAADHSTRVPTEEALGFISSGGTDPLFIQLSYPAPHARAGLLTPVPQVREADAPVERSHVSPAVNEFDVGDKPSFIRQREPIPERRLE